MSKSRITLECSEASGPQFTEACLNITRDDEPDPEMAYQDIVMTPAEMAAVYQRLATYYAHGIWTEGSVER